MSMRRATGLAAGLLLLAPLASFAADETKPAPAPQAQADADMSAIKVGKDPKTGELRKPSPAEEAELTRQMREFWAGFPRHSVKTDRRTGTSSLVVAPHKISTSVATMGPDGQVRWTCAEEADEMDTLVAGLQTRAARQAAVEGDR